MALRITSNCWQWTYEHRIRTMIMMIKSNSWDWLCLRWKKSLRKLKLIIMRRIGSWIRKSTRLKKKPNKLLYSWRIVSILKLSKIMTKPMISRINWLSWLLRWIVSEPSLGLRLLSRLTGWKSSLTKSIN